MSPNRLDILTLQHTLSLVGRSTPVPKQLISKAQGALADDTLRVGLEIDSGRLRSICPETEHLFPPSAISHQ